MLFGVLFVIAGVIAFISPENTFAAIADILGFLFLIVGLFWILQAFMERDENEVWWLGLTRRHPDGHPGLLDQRSVLHRQAVHAARLRRDLGADVGVTDIVRAFQINEGSSDLV